MTRVDETNLNINDKNSYLRQKDEMGIAIRAIEILEIITRSIAQAGGGRDIEGVADLSVKELAILAARNSINIEANYTGEPSSRAAHQEKLAQEKEYCAPAENNEHLIPF